MITNPVTGYTGFAMTNSLPEFIHSLSADDIPDSVLAAARRSLLDLLGVAISGTQTRLAGIVREHVVSQFALSLIHI